MQQDLRNAVRLLLKNPGFSSVAVLVLALGIGANSAVFTLVNALLLQPTPGEQPGVVGIYSRDRTRPDVYRGFSWAAYQDVRSAGEPFEAVMAYTMTILGVAEGDDTRRSFGAIVSASYFSTLGAHFAAGRGFTSEEERPDSYQRVVVVGHPYARKAGKTPGEVIGTQVRLNAREYTIVGVAPEGFSGTSALVAPEFWLPLGVYAEVTDAMVRDGESVRLGDPTNHALMLVGRLTKGLRVEAAAPLMASLTQRLAQADPIENKNHDLMVSRLSRTSISNRPQTDTPLSIASMLLMGTAGLVLLISCLNLANMLLARGNVRRKEIALRLALGSGRGRVVRQLLVESLLLALLGSAAGLLLASWGAGLLVSSLASAMPFVLVVDANPDIRVLAATIGFGVLSTVIAGLGPAFRATRPDILPDLKEQSSTEQGTRRRFTMRNALVVGQIALSLALLTAAGLFMRGAIKAGVADPGFPLAGGIVANVDAAMAGYDEGRGRNALRSILQRLRSTPGVQSASMASLVPFGEFQESEFVQKAGTPLAPEGQRDDGLNGTLTIVGADYFETLRVPVIRGRGFTASEEESPAGSKVAVIDEALARGIFGTDDPIGRSIQFLRRDRSVVEPMVVVGLVGGVRQDLFERTPGPHVYVPSGQHYRANVNLHVRLAGTGAAIETPMLGTIRNAIHIADDQVSILQIRTLLQHRDRSLELWAVNAGARLFSIFGAAALLLAVIGIYGVKSYLVSRRTREIGIRMALGATGSDVLWLVLREGLVLTTVGIGTGLLLAWGVAKALSGMLYEVSALDPVVFAIAPLLLGASAMVASYLPARRATHVAPLTALRTE